jgi:hypothetical protein
MEIFPKTKFAKIRFLLLMSVATWMVGYFVVSPVFSYMEYDPHEGDIIFQSLPDSKLTRAIEDVTDSSYSHTGIVIKKHGLWYVREAVGPVTGTI